MKLHLLRTTKQAEKVKHKEINKHVLQPLCFCSGTNRTPSRSSPSCAQSCPFSTPPPSSSGTPGSSAGSGAPSSSASTTHSSRRYQRATTGRQPGWRPSSPRSGRSTSTRSWRRRRPDIQIKFQARKDFFRVLSVPYSNVGLMVLNEDWKVKSSNYVADKEEKVSKSDFGFG